MNQLLNTDSYKLSQFLQYPEGTEHIFSYVSSRGGKFEESFFFGLQILLREVLSRPFTQEDINEANEISVAHSGYFNKEGAEYILEKYRGCWPVTIWAVPEGTIVPTGVAMLTITNNDPKCAWVTSFLETAILRAVWYATTVATGSWENRKMIKEYAELSSTDTNIDFKLHDFGARGVSSFESAGIGSLAHLATGFLGTDTMTGIITARKYYDEQMAGFSIPASEHSTITSWGRENEALAYKNMLDKFAKPGSIVACVSDSYDIFEACKIWGTTLKQQIINSGATLVIRPDSGDPASVIVKCLKILSKHFGFTINDKGYKVLNHNVRIIQGDGINHDSIRHILYMAVDMAKFSLDNIAFGQGGALLQAVDRDTLQFAMKCSAAYVNGQWRDVYKDPVTDSGKSSLKGRLDTILEDGEIRTVNLGYRPELSILQTVYCNGVLMNQTNLKEVRARANS